MLFIVKYLNAQTYPALPAKELYTGTKVPMCTSHVVCNRLPCIEYFSASVLFVLRLNKVTRKIRAFPRKYDRKGLFDNSHIIEKYI